VLGTQPREDRTLEASTSLGNAVNGLTDTQLEGATFVVVLFIPGRHVTVNHLTFQELALEVGGYPVNATY
jgi:hypothetical protein